MCFLCLFRSFAFNAFLNAWLCYASIVKERDQPTNASFLPTPPSSLIIDERSPPSSVVAPPQDVMLCAGAFDDEMLNDVQRTPSPIDLTCYEVFSNEY